MGEPARDRQKRALRAAMFCAVAGILWSCSSPGQPENVKQPTAMLAPPAVGAAKPVNYAGLHNVVTYHDGFVCGGVPEGEAGFDSLQAMGIKTIISVDGSEPDVAAAKARGMRYVHLPIGYNGFDETRKLELTRAVRDLAPDGPMYIHCHHGKHRSAGAAATVAVSLGWMDTAEATQLMKISGTAPNYTGLYKCTAQATPLSQAEIDAASAKFPEISPPSGFVQGMVEMDEISDHLKAIEKAGWKVPADHPDLVPVAEAGRLADLLRVESQGEHARSKPAEFATLLMDNSQRTQLLEDMLAAGEPDAKKLSAQFALVVASCKECHAKFRD